MRKLYLLACALGLFTTTQAEIIYTSYGENGLRIPLDGAFTLDVNDDGSVDFVFNDLAAGVSVHPIFGYGCTAAETYLDPNTNTYEYLIRSFDDNVPIDGNNYYDEGRPLPIWDPLTGGVDQWADGEPHYSAFMLWQGFSFGWMKLGYDAATSEIILYEWAWQNDGSMIEAGNRGANNISEFSADLDAISVYPNPAQEQVMVQLPENLTALQMSVYDNSGRMVMSQTIRQGFGNTLPLNIAAWEAGNYIIRFDSAEDAVVRKLAVLR